MALRLFSTHRKCIKNSETRVGVKLAAVPERGRQLEGVDFVIVVDTSNSMAGEKLEFAAKAAEELALSLPRGNRLTVYKFSSNVVKVWEGEAGQRIELKLKPEPDTRLHTALRRIAKEHGKRPTKLILLTDGEPTDKREPESYERLLPDNVEVTAIGVGRDYNEIVLKRIADSNRGVFHHVDEPSEVPKLVSGEVREVYAMNLTVDPPKEFLPINLDYPIKFPTVMDYVQVLGFVVVKPGDEPYEGHFKVTYDDPIGERVSLRLPLRVERGERPEVDQGVVEEIRYYELLKEYSYAVEQRKGAEEALRKLQEFAERTRRTDLMESTRRLTGDSKQDLSQVTRNMRRGK